MEVYKTNKILVLAFKRFTRHKKITVTVDFPLEGLDIGPYLLCNFIFTQQIPKNSQFSTIYTV